MVGLEFVKPGQGDGRRPNPEAVKDVLAAALERRLILLSAGTWGQVVRLIPPLVTTRDEVDLALAIMAEALGATKASL
jgi:4-aminobutyrate aminotransferase/(S)-3-amino-2-methylpropionate transaminase